VEARIANRWLCASAHRQRSLALLSTISPPFEYGMIFDPERSPVILVVEDVEETRDAIGHLLVASGYTVRTARNEADAILKARLQSPDLILMSLGLDAIQTAEVGRRVRESSWLNGSVPIVIFCVATLPEGAEAEVGYNIFMTRPDNFDQLRKLLNRLVRKRQGAG
jgi:CheY-like chemotaxis protein